MGGGNCHSRRLSSPVYLEGWWQWRGRAGWDAGSFPPWQSIQAESWTEQGPMYPRTGGVLLSRDTPCAWVAPRRQIKHRESGAHKWQVTTAWLHWDFTVGIFLEVEFTTLSALTVESAGSNLAHWTKTFSVTLNLSTPHNERREVMKANVFGRTDLACRMAAGRRFLLWMLGNPHCPGWSFPLRQVHIPASEETRESCFICVNGTFHLKPRRCPWA